MATENKAFYEAVTCVLSCALQPDSDIQRLAEERKKALEMVDDYPFTLVEIIGNSEEALAEKHMASIFLKNYFYDIFTESRENQYMKNPILLCRLCLSLLDLLRMNFISIKTMIAQSLSYVVYKGFWGIIDHKILPMLKSENEEQVYNAVFFLKHLMNYDEYRMGEPFRASPEYFEVLLSIFQKNIASEIRLTTIQPLYFVTCYCLDIDIEMQESALARLGHEFYRVLREPYSINSDFKLKSEIINYIPKFEIIGPTKHCYIITNSLPAIGQLMTNCCDQFKDIIKQVTTIPKDTSEDDDEESTNFMDLINLIMDLIKSMVFSMYFDLLLEDLDNLLYCLFIFMCCYDDMEEEHFLDDYEKSLVFPIRNSAAQILVHIRLRVTEGRRKGPETFYRSVQNVFHKLMEEASLVNGANRQLYHARITESLMYGLCVMNYNHEIDNIFPHRFYLDNWTAQMQQETNPLVNGRLLWLGGIFGPLLSPNTLTLHLKAIIRNVQAEVRYLYVPSSEALRNHMISYDKETMPVENQYIVKSLSKEIIECLLTMVQKMNNNPTSCLHALGIFIKHHEECTFAYVHNIQESLITTIYAHLSNLAVMKEINFIVGNIAMQKNLQDALHHTMIPFLCKSLHEDSLPTQLQGRKDAPEKALELLNTIAVFTTQSLSEALILEGFCGAANLLLEQQDYDGNMNEAAVDFITTIIMKVGSQLKYLRNSKEIALTEYIPKIIFECIDSKNPVSGLQVGKLCVISIVTLPELLESQFEAILKSVLSSAQIDNSYPNLRGVWLTFIYISMCRPANTINFLSSIPGPDGGSALQFLISMWEPEYTTMITRFERTVIGMALMQVISFALEGNREKLDEVEVQLNSFERNGTKMNGVEYLYFLLIGLALLEQAMKEDVAETPYDLLDDEDNGDAEDDILLRTSSLNIDIVTAVTQFLKHENISYFNVCRNYLYPEEIIRLSNMGCAVPQISME